MKIRGFGGILQCLRTAATVLASAGLVVACSLEPRPEPPLLGEYPAFNGDSTASESAGASNAAGASALGGNGGQAGSRSVADQGGGGGAPLVVGGSAGAYLDPAAMGGPPDAEGEGGSDAGTDSGTPQ